MLLGPESQIDPAALSVMLGRVREPELVEQREMLRVSYLTDLLRARLPAQCNDACKLERLRKFMFEEQGFSAEFDPSGLYNRIERDLVHRVIESHVGYCEGLTYLYLSLAWRIGLPVAAVAARQHMYVRYVGRELPQRDMDMTLGGRPPVIVSTCQAQEGVYGQPLTRRALAGRMLATLGIAGDLRALSWLERAAELTPQSPEVRHNLGLALARVGRSDQALDAFRAARQLDPCVALFSVNEARQLWAMGQRPQALVLLDHIERRSVRGELADNAFFLPLARASFAFEEHQDERVETLLREAVTQSDTAPVVLEAIATIRTIQGRKDDAIAAMRAAVRRDPTVRTRAGYLRVLLQSGRIAQAQQQLDRIEGESAADSHAHDLLRAMVSIARGATDEARVFALRCLREQGRDCARALVVLGDIAQLRGETQCARRYYEGFLQCPRPLRSRAFDFAQREVHQRLATLNPPHASADTTRPTATPQAQ